MIRRPPRSTRTDTLFPYTTLFRSTAFAYRGGGWAGVMAGVDRDPANLPMIRDWSRRYWADLHPTSAGGAYRSEEHTSELQSLMRISYAVFCLKKKSIEIKSIGVRWPLQTNKTEYHETITSTL